jgi:hypothetical protein
MAAPLDEQVARLERRLKRQQLVTWAALGLAAISVAVATVRRTSGEVRARAFQLIRDDGKMVAQLGVTDRGGPFLKLHAPEVGGDVLLGVMGEGLSGLAVWSVDEKASVMLTTDRNGGPSMSLTDRERKALLTVDADRGPNLLMIGRPGLLAASSKYLWLKDPAGKTVLHAGEGPPEAAKAP